MTASSPLLTWIQTHLIRYYAVMLNKLDECRGKVKGTDIHYILYLLWKSQTENSPGRRLALTQYSKVQAEKNCCFKSGAGKKRSTVFSSFSL